jgi:tripartite-type tricarboxylate transporter receptor subunit TctC
MRLRYSLLVIFTAILIVSLAAACGSDPTATPIPTNTPIPTPTPAAVAPGDPTPTPLPPTPTPAPAPARDLAEYFGGKTITFQVGFSPGGGYDTFSRIIGRIMSEYMPGNPRFVVRNLPGAGGLRGLRALTASDPDGYSIGYIHPRFVNPILIGETVDGFEIDDIILVGGPSSTERTNMQFVRKDKATTLQEMIDSGERYNFGSTEPGAVIGGLSNAVYEDMGLPLRVVYGYGGAAEAAAAVDRGELEICRSPEQYGFSLYPEWIEDSLCVPLFWYGRAPQEDPFIMDYLRLTGYEVPPHLFDIIPDWNPDRRRLLEIGEQLFNSLSRLVILPAGTPDDIVAAHREAFRKAVADPRFVESANALALEVGYGDPVAIQVAIDEARQLLSDPEILAFALKGLAG